MAEQWVGDLSNKIDSCLQLIPLPLPLLYISPPSSCLIMLLCVCLCVYLLCEGCVFLRSLCNVCVALILVFPLTIPQLLPSSLLTFDGYTPTAPLFPTKPHLFIYSLFFVFLHCSAPILFPMNYSQLPSTHAFIDLSIHSHLWFPLSPPPPLLLCSFTAHLGLLLFPFSSLLTLSTSFSSSLPPFLSLFHTVLCASLSLAGLLLGG